VLALAVLGERALSLFTAVAAPVLPTLLGFPVAAVLALVAQRFADRGRGRPAGIAGVAVLVITAATLLVFWWD
jgi:hypothetical protein